LEGELGDEIERQTEQSTVPIQIPFHYVNGFELNISLSDVGAMLMVDGQPQAKLSMSYTTARTLCVQLSKALEMYERITGTELKTIEEVGEKFKQAEK
jgi:hypothetical protein